MTNLKRMLKIAKQIETSPNPSEFDTDRMLSRYPELSLHQAILIGAYIVERDLGLNGLHFAITEIKQYK